MSSSDRTLIAAFKEISQMADRIQLPKTIVDRANKLFKQVHDGKNLRGRSNDAKASACLYIACRQEGVPRTFKEICAVSKISKKEIGRCFKLTLKALETSVDLITTADFMSRFCANLGQLQYKHKFLFLMLLKYFDSFLVLIMSFIGSFHVDQIYRLEFNALPPTLHGKL